jgi:hypothetical protein
MAKKSAAARQASASRRPPAAKAQQVTLVRAPGAEMAATGNSGTASTLAARTATVARPTSVAGRAQPGLRAASPTKPATPSSPARVTAAPATAGRAQAVRQAQRSGRTLPRARAANMVTAEHYAYVRKDLVVIAVLATALFLVIVGLYIYFHAIGQA